MSKPTFDVHELTKFLSDQINEDDATAKVLSEVIPYFSTTVRDVLRSNLEIVAYLNFLRASDSLDTPTGEFLIEMARILASAYSDRSGYNPEWTRPWSILTGRNHNVKL